MQFASAGYEANMYINECGHVSPRFQEGTYYRHYITSLIDGYFGYLTKNGNLLLNQLKTSTSM